MVRAVHTNVPGRARYSVDGLFGSESLKQSLESRLASHKFISHVSASTVTGTVLVLYHSGNGNDYRTIGRLVRKAVRENRNSGEELPAKPPSSPLPPGSGIIGKAPAALKEGISWLLPKQVEQEQHPWHLMDEEEALALTGTSRESGLTAGTALARLERYGPNLLPESVPQSQWRLFINQLKSLPALLLAVAAGLSLVTGGLLEAAVILGVLGANALIGYATERTAEKTIHSLKNGVRPRAEVIRDGVVREIPAEQVVFGDLFVLKPGTYVSADCRILEAGHLSIDESVLTGESMPALKAPGVLKRANTPLADRTNMAFMGTLVTGGEGLAVVVSSGRFTETGRLQILMGETRAPETPIERQLRTLGNQLVILCSVICGAVFVIGFLRGHGLLQMLRFAVSLAGAAVPEGLPAAATVNFSLGVRSMRRDHVLIRRLQAIETLGAVQTVCFDKTGTLTCNRMSVNKIFAGGREVEMRNGHFLVQGEPLDIRTVEEVMQLIFACALCNEVKVEGGDGRGKYVLRGSPTENALIHLALKAGLDLNRLRCEYPVLKADHRSEARLFMSTLHKTPLDGQRLLAVKGSPTDVLSLCAFEMKGGRVLPLGEQSRLEIEQTNDRMAEDALRVLGVAYARPEPGKEKSKSNGPLTWLGLVGMEDPLREEANHLVKTYQRAGIRTIMITGDQSPTAATVARQLDLSRGENLEILDSSSLTSVDPQVLSALARKVHVYSRVTPSNKLQIVQALQRAGQVVAMTGDGINDGPALKAADIGIAMGRSGTDVAREVADIVLEKDNLESLIIAVRDGRTTYANIRKSVHFFLSTNLTEIMVMFSALAAGIGFPLNVMQLLWINLMSDIFPGIALSMEAAEPDILERPPRNPIEPLLSSRDFKRMAFESAIISAGSLGAYAYGISRYGMGARAGSIAFHSLTAAQILHAVSCRSERRSIFDRVQPPPNRSLFLAIGGSLVLQALAGLVPGLRSLLGLTPLSLIDAAVAGAAAVLPLTANEATKKRKGVKE
ncbi:MAG: cation-transporting P-type ATPase [Desulfobacteraceae bacterium]|nr:MAG: cation-transporting P-type ATPase [Desulfobacteraceae bacterium]